jgi:hypothetical protein
MTRTTLARRSTGLFLAVTLLLGSAAPAAASQPIRCDGFARIQAITSGPEVREADGTVFVTLTFEGIHTLCLANGHNVLATIAGTLWQKTEPNGDMTVRFVETLAYNGSTLDYRGQGSLEDGVWSSAVRTVGKGTGVLTGIHGQGEFWPVAPDRFDDTIWYVYP